MKIKERITFFINDQPIEGRYGTTVEQAIIAYDQRVLSEIRELRAWVVDGRGARVGLGGMLDNGAHLYIRYISA